MEVVFGLPSAEMSSTSLFDHDLLDPFPALHLMKKSRSFIAMLYMRPFSLPALAAGVAALLLLLSNDAWSQWRNIRISAPGASPEEVMIAVNPTNPRNLIVGANLNYYAYSNDGGWTWQERYLTSPFGVWGDPCIIFDPIGIAYYAHLSNPLQGYWLDRLVVQRSSDGGATWSDGVAVGIDPPTQHDKEWMAADFTRSPWHGNIYMMWTRFDRYDSKDPTDSSHVLFSRSTDNGLTWYNPIRVADRAGDCIDDDSTVQGAIPAVGPNGEIYTTWSGPLGLLFDKSTDGGVTFGVDRFFDDQPGGWNFTIPGLQRCNGFPITLCDVGHSRYRGSLYVVWSDQRNGPDDTDIFFRRSTDGGESWSERLKVNSDTSRRHQFLPWAAVDPINGDIYVVFYDRRATTGNATDVYVARSTDGGESFTDFKVSESSFTPNVLYFLGDYIGITAYGGKAWPVWTRMDPPSTSVWTAIIGDSASTGVRAERHPGPEEGIIDVRIAPGGTAKIYFALARPAEVKLTLYDLLGRPVRHITEADYAEGLHTAWWDGMGDRGAPLPEGPYFIMMRTPRGTFSQKVMVREER